MYHGYNYKEKVSQESGQNNRQIPSFSSQGFMARYEYRILRKWLTNNSDIYIQLYVT